MRMARRSSVKIKGASGSGVLDGWEFGLVRAGRAVKEALEFGGESEAGEFVGHPDVGGAIAGVLDAGAEIARRVDFTGRGADDAGEEFVNFAQFQSDAGSAGFLDGFDAVGDGFPAQETVTAGGGDTAALYPVDVHVGLGGVSAGGDFAGEGFVA